MPGTSNQPPLRVGDRGNVKHGKVDYEVLVADADQIPGAKNRKLKAGQVWVTQIGGREVSWIINEKDFVRATTPQVPAPGASRVSARDTISVGQESKRVMLLCFRCAAELWPE